MGHGTSLFNLTNLTSFESCIPRSSDQTSIPPLCDRSTSLRETALQKQKLYQQTILRIQRKGLVGETHVVNNQTTAIKNRLQRDRLTLLGLNSHIAPRVPRNLRHGRRLPDTGRDGRVSPRARVARRRGGEDLDANLLGRVRATVADGAGDFNDEGAGEGRGDGEVCDVGGGGGAALGAVEDDFQGGCGVAACGWVG